MEVNYTNATPVSAAVTVGSVSPKSSGVISAGERGIIFATVAAMAPQPVTPGSRTVLVKSARPSLYSLEVLSAVMLETLDALCVEVLNSSDSTFRYTPGTDLGRLVQDSPRPSAAVPPTPVVAAAPGFPAPPERPRTPESSPPLLARKIDPAARLPLRTSAHAAGYDLFPLAAGTVPAGGHAVVKTGIAVACPPGTYARIAPRSGLAAKKMIGVGAGVVDFDYRGEVGVVVFNHGASDFDYAPENAVAQLILEKIAAPPVVESSVLPEAARVAGARHRGDYAALMDAAQ